MAYILLVFYVNIYSGQSGFPAILLSSADRDRRKSSDFCDFDNKNRLLYAMTAGRPLFIGKYHANNSNNNNNGEASESRDLRELFALSNGHDMITIIKYRLFDGLSYI